MAKIPKKNLTITVEPGSPYPLGATVNPEGVNFSVFSKYGEEVELLLFSGPRDPRPSTRVCLDPSPHRTHHYWHVFVPGLVHGQVYAWRVKGPGRPEQGHRFDGEKLLLDPYGRGVTGLDIYDRKSARLPGDNCERSLRSVVIDSNKYDWEDDHTLPPTEGRQMIYEMHLAGFTKSPTSGVSEQKRGTYAGLIEKIPYLLDLGITAVELLPIHHFDPQDAPAGKTNYWGYSSLSYFAPHSAYSSDRSPTGPVREFQDMVKALHKAGIRVILDVVYNHTAEAGADGPVLCFAGFENSAYYMLDDDLSKYADFTGCGNTLNANHSVVRRLILDSLRYWVEQMHVDGFRFDLASTLSRGEDGHPMDNPPILWAIESDPVLAGTSMIAEAWDAAGLYQVGSFTGDRFAQWNGPFRDRIRGFLRGDQDVIERLMARIVGSPDLFSTPESQPWHSINFVTCHDGFSLMDLVSYNQKHNLANGEDNRDGSDNNQSWNCGVEGPTNDPEILRLRQQQSRNFLCLLMLSHGTPMLTMGDEVLQSHQGNNNPWCQDNELAWLDWDLVESESGFLRFTRELINLAKGLGVLQNDQFWSATCPKRKGEISWHGVKPGLPDWSAGSKHLAFSIEQPKPSGTLYVLLNAEDHEKEFTLPKLPDGRRWLHVINTASLPNEDIIPPGEGNPIAPRKILAVARSVVVLMSEAPRH
ncbi:MAG: glycogen debranching protein GlgX [Gemmatimonadales bacterium]|nr:glycogen debranching protein GlgX [Gemmatimonadales bacterium]